MKENSNVIEVQTLNNICYERIKARILAGDISWGDRIDINQLSASFGISKFPVIKAIERLSLEKIVTIVPNKGTFVVTPDAGMVQEVSQIRNMIEEYALSYALDNARDELVREIKEVQSQWDFTGKPFEEIDRIDFLRYDRHFHLAIVKCTHNEQLVSYYRTIRSQIELFRVRTFKYSTVESAIAMHDEIVRAIENNGDGKAVIKCLTDHLANVKTDIEDTL